MDQIAQVTAQPVEFLDHQGVARFQFLKTPAEGRALGRSATDPLIFEQR